MDGFAQSQSWADAHDVDEEEFENDEPIQRRESERSVEETTTAAATTKKTASEVVLPEKAPFKAFVGNLSSETTEEDIVNFLAPARIVDVYMVKYQDKFKGFAYVQFDDVDSLKLALTRNGQPLFKKNVRVNIADERRKNRKKNYNKKYDRNNDRRRGDRRNYRNNNNNNNNNNANNANNDDDTSDRQRPKLNLKPRSQPKVDQLTDPNALSDAQKSTKPNPFGNAKPRELVLAERQHKSPLQQSTDAPVSPEVQPLEPVQPKRNNRNNNNNNRNRNKNRNRNRKNNNVPGNEGFVKVGGKKNYKKSNAASKKSMPKKEEKADNDVVDDNAFSALLLDDDEF